MSRIEKLTPEQERILAEFRARWFAVGICTARADRPKAEAAIQQIRVAIGHPKPPLFLWMESPATGLLAIQFLQSKQYRDWCLGKPYLRDSLGASLEASLGASLGASLRDSLWASLWASLRDSLEASLGDSLEASLRDSLGGQHEAYWLAYYLFCRDVLGIQYDAEKSQHLNLWRDVAESCCWWWCYENVVICCERPTVVRMNPRERIHAEHGPAIAFADGWQVHALNGVRMEPWMIDTDSEKLTVEQVLAVNNAEQRRELIRKIGIERVMSAANTKTIDTQGNYSLLEIDLLEIGRTRWLKMLNPSVGCWHVEGVPGDTATVAAALHFRKPAALRALPIDDVDGADWWQQGDVCIWPQQATSVKRYPAVLT